MGELIPEFAQSNKKDLKYLDILTHQARLRAWIPFWQDYIDSTDMIVHSKKFNQLKYSGSWAFIQVNSVSNWPMAT